MTGITGIDTPIALSQGSIKLSLNTESLIPLLRSNLSCHMNQVMTQEVLEQLTARIVESIDYFINKSVDNL